MTEVARPRVGAARLPECAAITEITTAATTAAALSATFVGVFSRLIKLLLIIVVLFEDAAGVTRTFEAGAGDCCGARVRRADGRERRVGFGEGSGDGRVAGGTLWAGAVGPVGFGSSTRSSST